MPWLGVVIQDSKDSKLCPCVAGFWDQAARRAEAHQGLSGRGEGYERSFMDSVAWVNRHWEAWPNPLKRNF